MEPSQLIQRTPLRAFDSVRKDGPGRGELGVVLARHGTGKTPFLVGVAVDHLLRGERVLHISLDQKVEHVREFYEQIFHELARSAHLTDPHRAYLEMERGRRIHSYLGSSFSLDKLRTAVDFMRQHASFEPTVMVLDGCDLATCPPQDVAAILEIARGADARLWMSAVRHRHEPVVDGDGIPSPVAEVKHLASVIVELYGTDGTVRIRLLRPLPSSGEPELPFILDPTTMLVRPQ